MRDIRVLLVFAAPALALGCGGAGPEGSASPEPDDAAESGAEERARGACRDAGAPVEACLDRAEELTHASPPDFAGAAEIYQRVCERRDAGRACRALAALHAKRLLEDASTDTARAYYHRSCELDFGEGCLGGGMVHLLEGETEEAASLLTRACELGVGHGCLNLAALGSREEEVSLEPARLRALVARAVELFEAGCEEEGSAASCRDLGLIYGYGNGVAQDLERAVTYLRRACDGEDGEACANLGRMHRHGQGIERDLKEARSKFRAACDLHHAEGCTFLARLLRSRGDDEGAVPLLQRACELGGGGGCYSLGVAHGLGEGIPVDERKAAEMYERACDFLEPAGCNSLGRMRQEGMGIERDMAGARELFERVCRWDEMPGCRDAQCRRTVSKGCNNAGALELKSDEEEGPAAARPYFEKACRLGHRLACQNLSRIRQGR